MGRVPKTTPEERGALAFWLGYRDAHEPPKNYGPAVAARWVVGFRRERRQWQILERAREARAKAQRKKMVKLATRDTAWAGSLIVGMRRHEAEMVLADLSHEHGW